MKKKSWRCYLCENNFYDEDMRGPLLFWDKGEEYLVCYSCGKDMGMKNITQKTYLLLQCPGCSRAFLPLLDFDTQEYCSKVIPCPFCRQKNAFKFRKKPEGSILAEKSPEEFQAG